MTAEDKLSAFLNEGRGPDRDVAFELAVLQRVAGRELMRTVGVAGLFALAAGVVLWAVAPVLQPVIEPAAATLAPAGAVLVVTACLVVFSQGLFRRA